MLFEHSDMCQELAEESACLCGAAAGLKALAEAMTVLAEAAEIVEDNLSDFPMAALDLVAIAGRVARHAQYDLLGQDNPLFRTEASLQLGQIILVAVRAAEALGVEPFVCVQRAGQLLSHFRSS